MDLNRKTALDVLIDIEKNQAYSNLSLNNFISKNACDKPAFVREIVYGVLKNKYLLDFYLKQFVEKGYEKLKIPDLSLLRMGAYQLLYMDSVPEFAAVSETVNLAKKYAKGKERFINGVLRNLSRNKDKLEQPEKSQDLISYFSTVYSCERWIAELILNAYGQKKAEEILKASNETPDLAIRVNILKTSREELAEVLVKQGFEVRISENTKRSLIVKGGNLLSTYEFKQGLFSVQDEASTLCTEVLDPKPGETLCDTCAAPGGKTVSICELMHNEGKVHALDYYESKLKLIDEHIKRNGIDIVTLIPHDGTKVLEELTDKCDKVLCDVPCSGLGVLRRKPEIKYKKSVDLKELTSRQYAILLSASSYLKAGGEMVYSTCTINPDENELMVERFLIEKPEFKKVYERTLLPQEGTDGFYICKMIREG